MKRLAVVLAAAATGLGLYAVAAPAGPEAVSPRRVAALERKVNALQRAVRRAQAQLACTNRVVGVSQFGDPNGTFGYAYRNPDASAFFTTALDLTDQGQRATFSVPIVLERCIGSAFRRAKP
jgi:hypothetical protein